MALHVIAPADGKEESKLKNRIASSLAVQLEYVCKILSLQH
jgi:hypothetical protein